MLTRTRDPTRRSPNGRWLPHAILSRLSFVGTRGHTGSDRGVRNGHWSRSTRTSADPEQDVLRLLGGLRQRRAEYARLPRLPWHAWRPAGDQPCRDREDDHDGVGARL